MGLGFGGWETRNISIGNSWSRRQLGDHKAPDCPPPSVAPYPFCCPLPPCSIPHGGRGDKPAAVEARAKALSMHLLWDTVIPLFLPLMLLPPPPPPPPLSSFPPFLSRTQSPCPLLPLVFVHSRSLPPSLRRFLITTILTLGWVCHLSFPALFFFLSLSLVFFFPLLSCYILLFSPHSTPSNSVFLLFLFLCLFSLPLCFSSFFTLCVSRSLRLFLSFFVRLGDGSAFDLWNNISPIMAHKISSISK